MALLSGSVAELFRTAKLRIGLRLCQACPLNLGTDGSEANDLAVKAAFYHDNAIDIGSQIKQNNTSIIRMQ